VSDSAELETLCADVLRRSPEEVKRYKSGKLKARHIL
jgi:Asp-tRNA(Asn)/Glu-tRNA(Gln) amidotransferase B subunit